MQRRDFIKGTSAALGAFTLGLGGYEMAKNFGAVRDDSSRDYLLGSHEFPKMTVLNARDSAKLVNEEPYKYPTVLLDALLKLEPNWRRGAQGIGDCVGWAAELCCTLNTAVEIACEGKPWLWKGPYATEPIYGGSRVEARGRDNYSWSDGSTGAWAAAWVTQFGALRRLDYSMATGQASHDLTTYDSDKAKQWGYYGCGGKDDKGLLDMVAQEWPVGEALLVNQVQDVRRALLSGYPVLVCSNQGFTQTRDEEGFCKPRGEWAHAMVICGYYVSETGREGYILANSWGKSNKGPCPYSDKKAIQDCTFAADADVVDGMLKMWNDSWIFTGVNGLEKRKLNWLDGWNL